MKLYLHPASPNCMVVLAVAALLEIALDTETIDLFAGQQRSPEYLAINPNGAVPALRDGDFLLSESSAIIQYLADGKPGNPLWPQDRQRRADIARWQFWSLAHWLPALRPFLFENLFKRRRGLGEPDPAILEAAQEPFHRYAGVLNTRLSGRDWLVGDGLTLADFSVGSYLVYAQPARVPLEDYANIRRWFGSIATLPAWRKVAPAA